MRVNCPIITVDWLQNNLDYSNLIVLNASIPKVTTGGASITKEYIPNSQFFDIKHKFSDVTAEFPNTVPSKEQFQEEAQKLGVNKDSLIVVYDDKGIYSSARAWWLFKAFGFENVVVLDGGLPEWKEKGYQTTNAYITKPKGNFEANYNTKYFQFFDDIQKLKDESTCQILDARNSDRFNGLIEEPREGLRSGHIPNSKSMPYTSLFNGNILKPKAELEALFLESAVHKKQIVFTCGSGVTACVLALAATLAEYDNLSVYDGSWTEYGSLT